jgi:hypothetical protein
MTATPQSQAIGVVNQYLAAAQLLVNLNDLLTDLQEQWTDDQVANIIGAMQTAPLNADGSLGTPDGSPNSAHYLTAAGLSRSVTPAFVSSLVTVLGTIPTLVGGSAVPAQGGMRQLLDEAIGS